MPHPAPRALPVAALTLPMLVAACSGGAAEPQHAAPATASHDDPSAGFDESALQQMRDKDFGKYLGAFAPSRVEETEGYTLYSFTPDKSGPICMQGAAFKMSTREGPSEDLILYMQGGGACWTGTCLASTSTAGGPYPIGWTDGNVDRNPLGDFDLVSLGYCDGSVFAGDNEVADPKGGGPDGIRYHHGMQNLSAGLDIAKKVFPNPRRIVLVGSSAGGYGTILGTALVRLVYPRIPLFVLNDAGLGLTNPTTPSMYATIKQEWDLGPRIPDDCPECADGQFTHLIAWALRHDTTIRVGAFSAYEDAVIGGGFLGMSGPDFKALLLKETGPVHDAFPDRFERYFIAGDAHTAVLAGYYDVKVNGVTLPEWTRLMLAKDPAWTDELAAP